MEVPGPAQPWVGVKWASQDVPHPEYTRLGTAFPLTAYITAETRWEQQRVGWNCDLHGRKATPPSS